MRADFAETTGAGASAAERAVDALGDAFADERLRALVVDRLETVARDFSGLLEAVTRGAGDALAFGFDALAERPDVAEAALED